MSVQTGRYKVDLSVASKRTLLLFFFHQAIRHKIIYYFKPDLESQACFELFTNLPADRELLLRSRDDREGCRELYTMMLSG